MKCKIKDIVLRVKDKVSLDCGLKYYVGGEHFDNGEILVKKHGDIQGSTIGPAFHMRFRPNQVLLMSRNPHLRKAGMVDFEGVCSDVSYVCETRNERKFKQKLIPFLFQSDKFWTMAEQNKRGSTNFFLNWSDFEEFEMNIPDPSKQEKLCALLWQMENTKQAYKNLLQKTDDIVKAKFEEMFGNENTGFKFPVVKLESICDFKTGGTPSRKHPEYFGGKIPWITTIALGKDFISKEDAQDFLTDAGVIHSTTHIIQKNSLLFGCRVGVGKSSINTCEMCTNQDIVALIDINFQKFDLIFIKKVLEQYNDYFDLQKRGATIKGIPIQVIKQVGIPCPPIDIQKRFTCFINQIEKTKEKLQKSLDSLNSMMRALINQSFN